MILLTPGPCMTSESVRRAGAGRDLNHREPEYQELFGEVREQLLTVYQATRTWTPYLIGGSGTAAVEAMVTSCVGPGKTLILENGYYSARIKEILAANEMPHEALSFGWTEPIDLEAFQARLAEGSYEAVVATHNETTTGRLNPIEQLGAICHAHGVRFLVDAMSSFGAEPIDFSNVDAICASANKCLHGIPGVAFVLATPEVTQTIRGLSRRSYYLALPMYEGERPPLTPPVPAMAAFRQALREMFAGEEPANERHRDYRERQEFLHGALASIGFNPVIPIDDMSVTLTTYRAPDGWTADEWITANRERGFLLYGCKGELQESHFQVSVMGEVTMGHLADWIGVVNDLLRR